MISLSVLVHNTSLEAVVTRESKDFQGYLPSSVFYSKWSATLEHFQKASLKTQAGPAVFLFVLKVLPVVIIDDRGEDPLKSAKFQVQPLV